MGGHWNRVSRSRGVFHGVSDTLFIKFLSRAVIPVDEKLSKAYGIINIITFAQKCCMFFVLVCSTILFMCVAICEAHTNLNENHQQLHRMYIAKGLLFLRM